VPLVDLQSLLFQPRDAVSRISAGDAARFAIVVAWLAGIQDILSTSGLSGRGQPNWGVFLVVMALLMGPLLSMGHLAFTGLLLAGLGRLLGGSGSVSDVRVALAVSYVPNLLLLPFWIPLIAWYGFDVLTSARGDGALAAMAFMALSMVLGGWSWIVRVGTLGEAHGFSLKRSVSCLVLGSLLTLALFVGTVAVAMKMWPVRSPDATPSEEASRP